MDRQSHQLKTNNSGTSLFVKQKICWCVLFCFVFFHKVTNLSDATFISQLAHPVIPASCEQELSSQDLTEMLMN